MSAKAARTRTALWTRHDTEWRDPAQVVSQWRDAAHVDPRLLRHRVRGAWWDTLAAQRIVLLVTREYEHLVMALGVNRRGPVVSYLPLPHPSGVAVDARRGVVHIASTRNPNQVHDLQPVTMLMKRRDLGARQLNGRPLVPIRSRTYPGCLYIHDLAIVGGDLYATAVGQNAVVRLEEDGAYTRRWWPRAIETPRGPIFDRNHLQLNSIAAGRELRRSFFSASTAEVGVRRPGHRNFPVDRRGVIFSGATREPIATGLTRPHSARFCGDRVWVDNSGYGEVGVIGGGAFEPVARLPGWTRGLTFHGGVAFVGTSRVIPRFKQYAPGLRVDDSVCGVHAVDRTSGRVLGSLLWPSGNQIFAIEAVPETFTTGFPFRVGSTGRSHDTKALFYAFQVATGESE